MSKHNKTIYEIAKELAVASPQATRHVIDHTTCINVEDEIEYMKWIDKRNAAQPAAGTPPRMILTPDEARDEDRVSHGLPSEGTTPQAERLVNEDDTYTSVNGELRRNYRDDPKSW